MSFIETPRFPEGISYGAIGGPGFNTTVVVVKSGHEQRNAEWSAARGRWDVAQAAKSKADFDAVANFFRICKGRANGFRFKDFADFEATHSEGILGTGVGTGLPTYQMAKKYASGSAYDTRTITKPVDGTCEFKRGGATLTVGAGAGNIAIVYTTGVVTFVADASSAASNITVGATTQVTLAANPGTLIIGGRLHLSGFTGADAALVNDLAHAITNITGSGPYVFTLSTNTAGKTITVGSGYGKKYPQPSETLTWSGQFDVPARFDTDELRAEVIAPGPVLRWDGIPIVEIRT